MLERVTRYVAKRTSDALGLASILSTAVPFVRRRLMTAVAVAAGLATYRNKGET